MSTSLDATSVQGTVTCISCDSPLHLACPNCGAGADYRIKPLREKRPPAPKHEPGFAHSPCVSCGGKVELTGKGRPHRRCAKCRGA